MKNITAMHSIVLVVAVCMLMACGSSPQQQGEVERPLDLNFTSIALRHQASQEAVADRVADAPGGGEAFFVSDAKTRLETGTYEILFSLDRPVDIRAYDYLVFDMMVDNIDLLYNIQGFFPRLFARGETWVQFGNSQAFHRGANEAAEGEWFTIRAPIQTAQANVDNFRPVKNNFLAVLIRLICDDMDPIDGRMYFRNFQVE